jgi:uncharacterized RDD family membrane protein YckC
MDIWKILELEPTPDQKAIKRAYAKKLKVTRPDENPQAFQSLHTAYKIALEEARYWEEEEQEDDDYSGEHYQEAVVTVTQQQENLITENTEVQNIHQNSLHLSQNTLSDDSENISINTSIETALHVETSEHLYQEDRVTEKIVREETTIEETAIEENAVNQTQQPLMESAEQNPQPASEINPYQVEGERLLAIAEALFSQQDAPAKARSWEFIIESPFILEDQFNWLLGLELLRAIHKHNFNHITKNSSMVAQEALTYLNSIFNWIDNRHYVIRDLGNEYNTWLDMIKENNSGEIDYRNQIRGGKKLSLQQASQTPITKVHSNQSEVVGNKMLAWILDTTILSILIILLGNGENSITHQAISSEALTFISIILIFVYFCGFEASSLQATPGKKIMGLAVITHDGNTPTFPRILFRTFCFFVFCFVFFILPIIILGFLNRGGFSTFVLMLGLYMGLQPITLYDKISKTLTLRVYKSR